ncbi:MAG: ROK family protein [Bacteroidales bacterium]|nr:ROK family protein [Bacteroidales bacterium]
MYKYYIGIDLGGTLIKIGVVRNGKVASIDYVDAESIKGLAAKLPILKIKIDEIIQNNLGNELGGIGLSFPGIVDPLKKRVLSTNKKYDDACDLDLNKWVASEWGVQFIVDNDARYAVIGEWKYGAAKDTNDLVMMTIGTGIGTGVVIDGRPLIGSHFRAPLGGHFIIKYDGRDCTCGNKGCVEAHSSSYFLPQIIRELPTSESFKANADKIDFKTIFEMSRTGNKDSLLVQNHCIQIWAAGIINFIHAYDPEIIVLGGGIMKSKDIIIPAIKEIVDKYAWTNKEGIKIEASKLGDDASILGIYYCLSKSDSE